MNSSRRTAELYPISALEVLRHFGWRSEQPALHAVDGRLRLGAHVGEVALALADQHGGDLAAVAADATGTPPRVSGDGASSTVVAPPLPCSVSVRRTWGLAR